MPETWDGKPVTYLSDDDDPEEEVEYPLDIPPVPMEDDPPPREPPPAVPPTTARPPSAPLGVEPKMGETGDSGIDVPLASVDDLPEPYYPPREDPEKPFLKWPYPEMKGELFDLRLRQEHYPETGLIPLIMRLVTVYGTPKEHGLGIALAALATVLGRRWRLATTSSGLPCNLYLWVVSDSGGGKSLALEAVSELLVGLEGAVFKSLPRSSNAYIEKQRQVDVAPFCWAFEESGAFFRQIQMPYAAGLVENFCDAFDGKAISVLRGEKKDREAQVEASRPLPTHFICGTVDALSSSLPYSQVKSLFTDGLFGRFLFLPGKRENLAPGTLHPEALRKLQDWFQTAARARPAGTIQFYPMQLDDEAIWLRDGYYAALPACPDPLLRGTWSRSVTQATKVAMLYHASMGRQWYEKISGDTMLRALKLINEYCLPAVQHLAFAASLHGIAEKIDKTRLLLRSLPGGIFLTELTRRFALARQEQAQILACLSPDLEFSTWSPTDKAGQKQGGRPLYYVALVNKTPLDLEGYVIQTTPEHTFPPTAVAKELDAYVDMPDGWRASTGPQFGDPA